MAARRVRILTLAATALGSAIAFLDTTVVIVALPKMDADLDLGLAGQQWVILSYSLALSALYLVSGAIGDRTGLRRTFVAGVCLFALASLVCAVAPDNTVLLAGRVLQGVGGAALTTTSLALLRVTWAGQSGRAIGLWTSLTSVATIAGPPLGGVLVETASWRWVFLINIPVAIAVVVLALMGRSSDEVSEGRGTLDLVGSGLAAVGLTGVSFALVEAGELTPALVVAAGLVGIGALVGLGVWTLRAANPVIPPRLLKRPGLVPANVVSLVLYASFSAHLLFWPVYLQFLGFSPLLAGLSFLLPSIGLVLLAPRFGRLADRIGPRRPIAAGAAGIAVAMALLVPIGERSDVWVWGVLSMIVFAIGLAAVVAPITAAALEPAPTELAGVASGLNQTVARAGGIVSIAAVGALAAAVFVAVGGSGATPWDPSLTGASRAAGIEAFRVVALVLAGLSAIGAALAVVLLRDRPA